MSFIESNQLILMTGPTGPLSCYRVIISSVVDLDGFNQRNGIYSVCRNLWSRVDLAHFITH